MDHYTVMSICLEYSIPYLLRKDSDTHESKTACQTFRGQQSTEKKNQNVKLSFNDLEDRGIFEMCSTK